ncbi:arsenical resistance protein ArsH [Sporothrix brasiliensis 5110]|uniref:Arsenical resistance protein ArsH n=1 Tax=Sporothrix brasiliensis 5110 TaxID=1398154 RepID=A0A0C2FQ79_9PEZI|nr:arsenical resistance protein ArsH [Sporothrix brasiliensis 5110]KIH93173.1 arsenical resistance protein ArsH [Sporothrix brasiliensis 5110]
MQRSQSPVALAGQGDLNNAYAARAAVAPTADPTCALHSLAIDIDEDDAATRDRYRSFLLSEPLAADDWVAQLELGTVLKLVASEILEKKRDRLRILVLHGSLRSRSFSRLLAYEAARILFRLGCDVRVYNPAGLPQKDDIHHGHPKVQELRELSKWSDGHVWVSPEQHGNLTGLFKQQIDWIPLSSGAVRPTQGRTLAVAQVSGGSQPFNAVNSLRILGRWMRMFTIPNQSSVPKAYTQFTPEAEGSRMLPSANRDRLVDCMEELVKYTIVLRPRFDLFGDRFSEREERRLKREKAEEERNKEASTINGVSLQGLSL